ncbi:YraN family protein [Microvirga sp. KLBC 81]|uniref:YraN family protein n=1 Tax=Microvirga sp. KLBC 81 TaxID=1862707 RepID=UPI000D50F4AB|nr:YraN family protein [Microvirga sp. KLBC 81]PVE25837.1 YraN family protein [Microvirga sp. KLBC 81]
MNTAPEHFSAKWIRFAVQKCGRAKGRADSTRAESALARRRATFQRGHYAEWIALLFLLTRGYRPLARRYAAAGGEIDLIMARGDTIAFVEVKARGSMDDALSSITAIKRQRFSRAVRSWLSRHPHAQGKTWRADAVFIAPRRLPKHIVSAFELEIF